MNEIIDTRAFDWETQKPDPTTGDPVDCECCGRQIVVHAHVLKVERLTNKIIASAVIGTGCCKTSAVYSPVSPQNRNNWRRPNIRFRKK